MAIRRTGSQTLVNRGVTAAAATPVNIITGTGGPTVNISSIQIANSTFVAKDDLAIDTAGGYMIINGTGFQSGAVVYIQGTAATSTSFVSSSRLNVTVPALSSGLLDVYVVNTDGSGSIYLQSLRANGVPSWTTTSPLTSQDDGTAFAINLVASGAAGDGTITYAVSAGSTLPSGTFLASNGYFYGTVSGIEQETTYSFSVDAIDAQNQETARSFNITVRSGDLNFKDTVLLLNGETSINAWITDASTNNFALTVNGDTRPVAFSPYETVWSNLFDGTGDYLSIASPPSSIHNWYSTDFTCEGWIFPTTLTGLSYVDGAGTHPTFIGNRTTNDGNDYWGFGPCTDGQVRLYYFNGSSGNTVSSGLSITVNRWNHIAFTKTSSGVKFFVNGIASGFTALNGTPQSASGLPFLIGVANNTYVNGYISNVRLVNGTAVYTSAFTPPTSPLTAIANTSLLTCQSNRLIDNSTNNFTITKNGDVSVSNFGPFVETDLITGSGYFDGTGDYLTVPNVGVSDFGIADFAVEMWIFPTSLSTQQMLICAGSFTPVTGADDAWFIQIGINNSGNLATINQGSTNYSVTGWSIIVNQWQHLAFTRSSGSLRLFINGVQVGSTVSANITVNSNAAWTTRVGVYSSSSARNWFGYVSNLRILKGTAVYTSNFTPPTSPLTAIANTSLLTLQSRIGENNNRFVDSSGMNNIITRSGNISQGTFSPYQRGGWSNYFDGTGDYLSISDDNTLDLTADFTIEGWAYVSTSTDTSGIISKRNQSAFNAGDWRISWNNTDSKISIATGSENVNRSTPVVTKNQWVHFAFVRSGTTLYCFANGVLGDTDATWSYNLTTTEPLLIGRNTSGFDFTGYISNLRILKGTALYTSNFTPPTSPLTAIANTSLLTCQSNGLIDNSPNNFTITRNGDVSVQPFSPFKVHTITANTHSVYFDGTGDFLTIPSSSTFDFDVKDFTIEFWMFPTASQPSYAGFIVQATDSDPSWFVQADVGGTKIRLTTYQANILVSNSNIPLNQWTHIAIVRNGGGSNNCKMYFNGVLDVQGTFTADLGRTDSVIVGGGYLGGSRPKFIGYLSNMRIVNGTAVYTSAFTPPTSPLTTIANTTLLTCSSNTIVDLSTANTGNTAHAITVNGDARPTTVNPLGFTVTTATGTSAEYSITNEGGSMYFDGTGDYVAIADRIDLRPGTSNFTLEAWIYRDVAGAAHTIYAKGGASTGILLQVTSTNILRFTHTTTNIDSTITIPAKSWTHVAVVREGTSTNQTKLYINGVFAAQGTVSTDFTQTEEARVGTNRSASENFNGYISNLRILKGTAVYTSGFVPPAAPTLPIAGTTLLVNGTNSSIIDYTRKNNLETVGDVRIRNDIKKYGNTSMFFDGTGDRLRVPYSPNLLLGSGNFTVEMWLYKLSNTAYMVAAGNLSSPSTAAWIIMGDVNGTKITWYTTGDFQMTSTTSLATGTWYHLAITRSGTTGRMFINGTQEASWTDSVNYNVTNDLFIGNDAQLISGRHWNGYIDDLRITKGVARYTSNFSVPSSQFLTS